VQAKLNKFPGVADSIVERALVGQIREFAFAYSSISVKYSQQPQACRPAGMPHVYQY